MALQFDNRTASRKVPVKRNTKFFSGEDFDLELNFAKEYIEQDANQTVILYQIVMPLFLSIFSFIQTWR